MEEVRYFKAEDGTLFENEFDCRHYERGQENPDLLVLSTMMEKITPDDCTECAYAKFNTKEALKKFISMLQEDGIGTIGLPNPDEFDSEDTMYFYDDEFWYNLYAVNRKNRPVWHSVKKLKEEFANYIGEIETALRYNEVKRG